ncbi:MAG: carbohydrate kinase family protein [Betaproteobacteria bacterium]|nr:carbohydrate kinase family protein [Betaproteobacteria bacterium]
MRTLICGSMAFDTIMVFHDQFKNHILPEQIHILNVAFLVPDMRREYGGCAGNIAYNMKLLGGEPVIMATVGDDFGPYHDRLDLLGLERTHVREIANSYTAQAFITTDLSDNQITAFHPGAMNFSHENQVMDASGIGLGIVSPDGRQGMIDHARQFHEAGIPFIFDPGQGLPMFGGEELLNFVHRADYLTVNDYEAKLLQERTGLTLEQLAKHVQALIVTLGGDGSRIYADGQVHDIPVVKAAEVVDPTGCGDAFRAGLMTGLHKGYDWPTIGRLAGLVGTVKIGHRGGQNHRYAWDEIAQRFKDEYGYALA